MMRFASKIEKEQTPENGFALIEKNFYYLRLNPVF